MDDDKSSQEDPSSPIKDESAEMYQSIPDVAQAVPVIAQDMTDQNTDSASRDTGHNDISVVSRRTVHSRVPQNETLKLKENTTPQKPQWEFNPCNVAIIIGIGCVGFLAFMTFK